VATGIGIRRYVQNEREHRKGRVVLDISVQILSAKDSIDVMIADAVLVTMGQGHKMIRDRVTAIE